MKAKHLLPLALTLIFSSPLWGGNTNPFQGWQSPPQTPGQSQTPQLAPPSVVNMQSQAVQVYTLPDGRYHAEINYQEKADDTRKYTFEGSKDEIRQQLEQSGLPEDRKQAVLQSLEMNPGDMFGNLFGNGNGSPFGNSLNSLLGRKDPFDHPFFKQNPFNNPFFQNDPFGDDFFEKFFQNIPQLQAPPGMGQSQPQPMPWPEIEPPAPVKPAFPAQPSGKTEWL